MKGLLAVLASGLLFGLGLGVSGMTRPERVLDFLDVTGDWDPALAFVLGGAVLVHAVLLRVVRRRNAPLFGKAFFQAPLQRIDRPLLLGAAIFGIGWGLVGVCPGPGLVTLGGGSTGALLFVATMAGGMALRHLVAARKAA